ncbi:MAG: enoyl-CoA hydratase/isomerase family protein, partial [Myxococcales bacterium]
GRLRTTSAKSPESSVASRGARERGASMGLEFAEEVAILRMDFGKANAIGDAFLQKMSALLEEVAARKARALVLTGDGRIFCAGLDLPALLDRGAEEIGAFVDRFSTFMLRVFELPIPVVAAIDGHAVAGGCVLALQTDFRVMSAGTIGLNEVRIGVGLPAVVLETLRLQVSPSSLRTIALEGRLFEPDAALAIGLVDEVVPPDRLMSRAMDKARDLASVPPVAFARIKQSLRAQVAEAARRGAASDKKVWATGFASPETQTILREVVERLRRKRG